MHSSFPGLLSFFYKLSSFPRHRTHPGQGIPFGYPYFTIIRIRWPHPSSVPATSDGLSGSYAPWMTFSLHGASVKVEKNPLDHRNEDAA